VGGCNKESIWHTVTDENESSAARGNIIKKQGFCLSILKITVYALSIFRGYGGRVTTIIERGMIDSIILYTRTVHQSGVVLS
jgi:hypothetical protein